MLFKVFSKDGEFHFERDAKVSVEFHKKTMKVEWTDDGEINNTSGVNKIFYNWLNECYLSEQANANEVKRLVYLSEGESVWKFKGCFPSTINFGDAGFFDSAEITVELTIHYDEVSQ